MTGRAAGRGVGFALAFAISSTAFAQATPGPVQDPVPGAIPQAIADTVGQRLSKNGASADARYWTIAAIRDQIADDMASTTACFNQPGAIGWAKLLRCAAPLVLPWSYGQAGTSYTGKPAWNGFGGAGSSAGWTDESVTTQNDCADLKYQLDADGNLIIPSFGLAKGGPVLMGKLDPPQPFTDPTGGPYYQGNGTGPFLAYSVAASNAQAVARRLAHLVNLGRPREEWFGVVGPFLQGDSKCVRFTVPAYRKASGELVYAQLAAACGGSGPRRHGKSDSSDVEQHEDCPSTGSSGGGFDFYGTPGSTHFHKCVWFAPSPGATGTADGYAINPNAVLFQNEIKNWPLGMPQGVGACGLSAEFLRKFSDELWRRAALRPGYQGAPYTGLQAGDGRPGTAKVQDLVSPPVQAQKTPNLTQPPPPEVTPPTTGTGTGTGSATVDLGPNPGTPSPTLEATPTGTSIVAPIKGWFPTVPTITVPTSTVCPTWTFHPFTADIVMNSHCTLIEQNRAILSALMIGLFTLMAGLTILRA